MIESRVFKFAIFVRIFVIILQVIFNNAVPDHNADAFHLPHEEEKNLANKVASFLFDGFSRWDSQYFLHIALYGYTHENVLAFFPFFPLMVRFFSSVFSVLKLSDLNCMLVTGVMLNSLLSSLAAVALYKLTMVLFRSESFALTSAVLFCINPASIFFSALYSESLFAVLTFYGLYFLESGKFFRALLFLGFSALARSNGVLAAGYIVYKLLKNGFNSYTMGPPNPYMNRMLSRYLCMLKILISLALFIVPFAAYQTYCYLLFCTSFLSESILPDIVNDYLTRNDLKTPSEPSKWCFKNIPLSYSYVQSRYWDVGYLKYFTIKQLPNFLLALPVFLIVFVSCIMYFSRNKREILHLGLVKTHQNSGCDIYKSIISFPYFVHIAAITLFSTLYIHIQVLTRLLFSCSPLLYWVATATILPSDGHQRFRVLKETHLKHRKSGVIDALSLLKKVFLKAPVMGKFVIGYFTIYFWIGIFLHVNFFPWT